MVVPLYTRSRRRIASEICFQMFPAGPRKRRATTFGVDEHRLGLDAPYKSCRPTAPLNSTVDVQRNTRKTMPPVSTRSSSLIVSAVICTILNIPVEAQAQDTTSGSGQPRSIWDVTLGVGAAVRPTFEGSDRYRVSPIPLVNVTWNDMISLGTTGLSAYWRYENLRVGGGLTYGLGRTQNNDIFGQSDNRLAGLGDIPAALGVRGFADYRLGFVDLNASITKFTANGNNGVLVNFGAAIPYKLTDATTFVANVSATWADQSYMQTYFGVTSTQAANSGFARYDAGAGIKDVGIGIGLNHKFDQHWAVSADVRVTRLTGDAENSPIVFSKTQATFVSALKYHF